MAPKPVQGGSVHPGGSHLPRKSSGGLFQPRGATAPGKNFLGICTQGGAEAPGKNLHGVPNKQSLIPPVYGHLRIHIPPEDISCPKSFSQGSLSQRRGGMVAASHHPTCGREMEFCIPYKIFRLSPHPRLGVKRRRKFFRGHPHYLCILVLWDPTVPWNPCFLRRFSRALTHGASR